MSHSVPSHSVPSNSASSYLGPSRPGRSTPSPPPDFRPVPPAASPETKEDLFFQNVEMLYECSLGRTEPLTSAKLRLVLMILQQQTLAEHSTTNRNPSPSSDISKKAVFRPIVSTKSGTVPDRAEIAFCGLPNLERPSPTLKRQPEVPSLVNKACVALFSLFCFSSDK